MVQWGLSRVPEVLRVVMESTRGPMIDQSDFFYWRMPHLQCCQQDTLLWASLMPPCMEEWRDSRSASRGQC